MIYGFTMNNDETIMGYCSEINDICCKLWIFSETNLHHRNLAKQNLRAQARKDGVRAPPS